MTWYDGLLAYANILHPVAVRALLACHYYYFDADEPHRFQSFSLPLDIILCELFPMCCRGSRNSEFGLHIIADADVETEEQQHVGELPDLIPISDHEQQTITLVYLIGDNEVYFRRYNLLKTLLRSYDDVGAIRADRGGVLLADVKVARSPFYCLGYEDKTDTFIATLPNDFLSVCDVIRSVEFTGFGFEEHSFWFDSIPRGFMSSCPRLQNLCFHPLLSPRQITSVGDRFLFQCESLADIDFTRDVVEPGHSIVSIGSQFLAACTALTCVRNLGLVIASAEFDAAAATDFLADCSSLPKIDLSWMSATAAIPSGLLRGCTKLRTVRLPEGNKYLRSIGHDFLRDCRSVKELELSHSFCSSPSAALFIGNNFCADCSRLQTIDTTGLCRVVEVGSKFLAGCVQLTHIDLSGLSPVSTLDAGFLDGCVSLNSVDLSPLSNLIAFPFCSLTTCTGLTAVTLGSLPAMTNLDTGFLSDHAQLQSLELSGCAADKLSEVPNSFLSGNSLLSGALDLRTCFLTSPGLTKIGEDFLLDCASLTAVELPTASVGSRIGTVHRGFLSGCSSLTSLSFESALWAGSVHTIENEFALNCAHLASFDLTCMTSLTSVGCGFLSGCVSLTSVNVCGLFGLRVLGPDFLRGCITLTSLDLSDLTSVTTIGCSFLAGCTALQHVMIGFDKQKCEFGPYFMSRCSARLDYCSRHQELDEAKAPSAELSHVQNVPYPEVCVGGKDKAPPPDKVGCCHV
eukprot:PhM_4_TR2687/c0_g1_i1/m.9276